MAPKKSKPTEAPPAKDAPPGFFRSLRRQLYRPLTLVTAAFVVGLTFGWPIIRSMLPDLAVREEYRVRSAAIRIAQPPHWVPRNLVEQVISTAGLPEELSLLNDNVARDVAEAFALHPWVEEVVSVKKSFPAAIDVEVKYRTPVAMVEQKQGRYPVDARGTLLPTQDFSPTDAQAYPQIAGIHSTPQGPAGSDWGDPIVTEAARLASEIAPQWKKLHLASIVCPRSISKGDGLDEGVFTLTTSGGSEIVWGHGPGSDHPGELSISQKIERLEWYAAKFGGLDQPQGRFRIDIRHWRNIGRVPVTTALEPLDETRR